MVAGTQPPQFGSLFDTGQAFPPSITTRFALMSANIHLEPGAVEREMQYEDSVII